jgi:multidrug efflux pump subunit AcrB
MTTVAMVAGMMPAALAFGAGASFVAGAMRSSDCRLMIGMRLGCAA